MSNKQYIFDIVRKKYVCLTPEEWTRQHLLHYLINVLAYPKSLIRVEKNLVGYSRINRADLVAYNQQGKPLLVAECKARYVPITHTAYNQVVRYNRNLKAPCMVITNGITYGCWQIKQDGVVVERMDTIPTFAEIIAQ